MNEFKFPVPPPSQKDIEMFYDSLSHITDEKAKESKMCEDPEYPLDFGDCLTFLRNGDSRMAGCPKCGVDT